MGAGDVAVSALFVGSVGRLHGVPSAMDKRPTDTPVRLGPQGLVGDEQADRRHHGGLDKALHHYPLAHYAAWREELSADLAGRLRPGFFGENLALDGLDETTVCIGDRFRFGDALIEVSQARQPCWKLNLRSGLPDMVRRLQDSGRTGWYYRVLEQGTVCAGNRLEPVGRPHPDWPLARVLHHLYRATLDRGALQALVTLPELASSWRAVFSARLETGCVEDWSARLDTPAAHRVGTV